MGLQRHLVKVPHAAEPGIVHKAIDRPSGGGDSIEEGLSCTGLRQVAREHIGPDAVSLLQTGRERLQFVATSRDEDYVGLVTSEQLGEFFTNSRGGSGNQCSLDAHAKVPSGKSA